ncbi:ABC transporter ATP-binding protein [Plastorhodobacter daqingensis]|uniref:ABC transporter ATP-binding protein n=1 Tax=Plastorhodobacter daqingensis TaxID=1387281 RepID=A0ABW2UKC0_9RHOB
MTIVLRAEGVAVHGAEGRLVAPISLTLKAGRPFTILGETGSGKSLLLQALTGTLPAGLRATGSVTLAGRTLDPAQPHQFRPLWGRMVGILPQEPWRALDPLMSAEAQVAEGHALVAGLSRAEARAAARRDLSALGLDGAGGRRPDQLSGGMAQRVAFAAARAGGARIMIADEPSKGLDAARRDDIIALLMRELQGDAALLTITHDLELARSMGGDLAVMLQGRVIEQGPAARVLAAPQQDYTRRLIAADPAAWPQGRPRLAQGDVVLSAQGLGITRGGRELFRDLDLAVAAGEILGVTGPSGCGKSTLGDVLLGLVRPDRGSVMRPGAISGLRYQKLFQDPPSAFAPRATLGQSLDDLIRRHGLSAPRIPVLMERLRLRSSLLSRHPDEVSGGELQRVALLRVLLLDPVFLFADEPSSRLDLITQAEVMELLVQVARDSGMALLVVSHDAELIRKTADRVLSLEQGQDAALAVSDRGMSG